MDDLGSRLRQAITDWGTIVGFQREISRYPIRGTSRATIHAYLNGRTVPSPEFLEHAGKILGVREDWLRTGRDPKLRPPDEALPLRTREKTLEGLRELLSTRVEGVYKLDHVSFELFLRLLTRFTLGAPDGRGLLAMKDGQDRLVELARDLMFLVNLPRDPGTWGFESLLDPRWSFEYFTASLHALSLLLPEPGRGSPLGLHPDSRIPSLRRHDFNRRNDHHEREQEDNDGEDA
ncbi:MAG: helix-turn-helix domain-containing protein [Gemmatimonadota bacterium]